MIREWLRKWLGIERLEKQTENDFERFKRGIESEFGCYYDTERGTSFLTRYANDPQTVKNRTKGSE